MPATAAKPKKSSSAPVNVDQMANQLADARKELSVLHLFLDKIQTFSVIVGEAKGELKRLEYEEHELKDSLRDVRDQITSLKELISSSNNGMLKLIEPGPVEFMPLFDKMEKADPETHGENAAKWREEPVSVLRLSPASTELLYAAEILFVGQLQDRILDDPHDWWKSVAGLTPPIAAAIADKLADFSKKGGAL